jgi:hypothetical protein
MDVPEWYWIVALAFVALIVFGIPEFLALRYGGATLSRFMVNTSRRPFWGRLWLFAWGVLIGALFVHWNGWCMEGLPPHVLDEVPP